MAQKFNEFYVNIGNMIDGKIPQAKSKFSDFLKTSVPNSIFLSPVDDMEISDMFSKIDGSKSCGPNSIPSNLLKEHAKAFFSPVKEMINSSFSEGTFPSILKIAQVCTVFQKGELDLRENYRPISLLSNFSKLFERAMHSRVYNFRESSGLIFDFQFGFRKKHSTSHAILSILDEIRQNLDNNTFSCGVFVDLEKAFDTVNHDILLKKLEHYGIRNIARLLVLVAPIPITFLSLAVFPKDLSLALSFSLFTSMICTTQYIFRKSTILLMILICFLVTKTLRS